MFEHKRKWILLLTLAMLTVATAAQAAGPSRIRAMETQDLLEVKSEATEGVPLTLNLADGAHRRFLARLMLEARLLGGTSGRDLYDFIERMADAHESEPPPQDLTLLQLENEYGTWRLLGLVTHLHKTAEGRYSAAGLLAVPGTIYATLFLQLYDADWQPIGDLAVADNWLQNDLVVAAEGRAETPGVAAVLTYFYHAQKDSLPVAQVIFKSLGEMPDPTFSEIQPSKQPTCTADKTGNGVCPSASGVSQCVNICLGRGDGNPCDYCPTTGGNTSRIVTVAGKVNFDNQVTSGPDNATMYIVSRAAGACKASITPGGFTVSSTAVRWNFGEQVFNTSNSCWNNQRLADFYLKFDVVAGNAATVTVTSAAGTCPNGGTVPCNPGDTTTCCIDPLYFVWGCLAAGTPVRMADGSLKPVEDVLVQEKVRADADGRILTVVNTYRGTEELPLVVVQDDRGHTLRLTEAHPVPTARGIVLAKQLVAGDSLTTEEGQAQVVNVRREVTTERVYNLDLGDDGETVTEDNTTFFAAGILVGDNQMQGTYEQRYKTGGDTVTEIPEEWRHDYEQWVEKKKKKKKDQ